ncbi:MAG: Hpt domain-containing protein [Alphaproteobacteria bacterium]|nr:Hpt domain-containing protein [Alphaproteobacteria bacterium]
MDDRKKSDNHNEDQKKVAVEIIKPLHPIKEKVSGSGGPSPEMLAKAQAAISKMSDDYPGWAIQDVETLEKLIQDATPGVGNGREKMHDAFKLAHDMRGQGGSFGFPLMTRIANSFCRFVEGLKEVDEGALGICMAHVNAMRAILQNNVRGTGGPIGDQIADGLELAVKRYSDKLK